MQMQQKPKAISSLQMVKGELHLGCLLLCLANMEDAQFPNSLNNSRPYQPARSRAGCFWAYSNHVTSNLTPAMVEDAIFLRADLAEVAGVEATTVSESRRRGVRGIPKQTSDSRFPLWLCFSGVLFDLLNHDKLPWGLSGVYGYRHLHE